MRLYRPTYPARYRPRPPGEPARAQIGLAPLVEDRTPDVIPASELYGRQAKSVRALFADSRISGAARRRQFDASGRLIADDVIAPKSPYYAIRLHPEQYQAVLKTTGHHPEVMAAPIYCGCQPGDGGLDTHWETRMELQRAGIMTGVYAGAGCDDPPDLTAA